MDFCTRSTEEFLFSLGAKRYIFYAEYVAQAPQILVDFVFRLETQGGHDGISGIHVMKVIEANINPNFGIITAFLCYFTLPCGVPLIVA